jgi:hypothetical protein
MTPFIKPILCIVVAATLLVSSGCQSGPVSKPGFDFSRYHTFALLPLPEAGTYQDPTIAARLREPGTQAIVETLAAKGFQQVPENEADFLVNLSFDYQPEADRNETRLLDIQVIDARSREVVWSTWWHRTTDMTLPPGEFRKVIQRKLAPFPPGPAPAGH